MIEPTNPNLESAKNRGLFGIGCLTLGILLVFVVPEGAFGAPEIFAVIGMLSMLSAAWKAAESVEPDSRT